MLPVALDAMGGDKAPAEIVAGARQAVEAGYGVVLVGRSDEMGDVEGLEVIEASEVIAMDEDAAQAARRKKDSSLVRAAEAVRDGRACAMISAGNTGAAMACALFRLGRLPGVARPAIATPIPVPGATPTVMLDAGANADCQPEWLVQFAQMGSVYSHQRYGIEMPRVGLLSIGEEPTKGSSLVKDVHKLLAAGVGVNFIGNVEGRDILSDDVDVVVTDGFTGNVALKAMEGALKFFMGTLAGVFSSSAQAEEASAALMPALIPLAEELDPESTGGALLLGVKGVCIISHGSSSARAVVNAVRVAHDMTRSDLIGHLAEAVAK
ncbi:MAG: phosphate acyltransferase PlsX [Acidimicrobiales bacterium]